MVNNYDPAGSSGVKKEKQKADPLNTPPYMRSQVSDYFLAKNPQYRKLFHKCPNCGKNSLKPINLNTIYGFNITSKGRRCRLCGYENDNI